MRLTTCILLFLNNLFFSVWVIKIITIFFIVITVVISNI